MNKENALKQLREVCGTLAQYGVNYWVDGGTLLGIVREQRLLPWDDDIDLSIKCNDLTKLENLRHVFHKKGYSLSKFFVGRINNDIEKELNLALDQAFFAADSCGIMTWLENGSLLGIIRDKKLLSNADRAYIGMLMPNKKSLEGFIGIMEKEGFLASPIYLLYKNKILLKSLILNKKNAILEIVIGHPFGENLIEFTDKRPIIIPSFMLAYAMKINIGSRKINVPKLHEEYLQFRYGKWKIPKVVPWTKKMSPGCRFNYLTKIHKNTITIDLITKFSINSGYIEFNPNYARIYPSHFYDYLQKIEFNGTVYPTPSNPENYLSYIYGQWKDPVREWDNTKHVSEAVIRTEQAAHLLMSRYRL